MSDFTLDISGAVYDWRPPNGRAMTIWYDLSPFEQGYFTSAARSLYAQLIDPGHEDVFGEGASRAVRFSNWSPETLAAIRKDCATFARMYGGEPLTRETGAKLWRLRQDRWPGTDFAPAFPPLTPTLGDDGRVYLREAA